MTDDFDAKVEKLASMILDSRRIVIFTGAGISTESGISDFRSPGGIWSKHDPEMFTIQRFVSDIEARKLHWHALHKDDFIPHDGVFPNEAHQAAAELEKTGRLDCIITQNVDGLHEDAGNSPELVFHLHGTLERAICMNCSHKYSMEEIREWMNKGIEIPDCEECGGMLKPDAVLFGEALPEQVLNESQRRAQNCDLCIVIGSSLVVYPAALIPRYAVQSGAGLAIINRDRTDLDSYADICIHESAGLTMSNAMKLVRKGL